jgi:hypothetical protein
MVIQVNPVFQDQKVNVVYVVFQVYLAIQQLLVVNLAHKDLLVQLAVQVPLVFKVLLVWKELKEIEVSMVFVVLVMVWKAPKVNQVILAKLEHLVNVVVQEKRVIEVMLVHKVILVMLVNLVHPAVMVIVV